jgi:hypothetical protein
MGRVDNDDVVRAVPLLSLGRSIRALSAIGGFVDGPIIFLISYWFLSFRMDHAILRQCALFAIPSRELASRH